MSKKGLTIKQKINRKRGLIERKRAGKFRYLKATSQLSNYYRQRDRVRQITISSSLEHEKAEASKPLSRSPWLRVKASKIWKSILMLKNNLKIYGHKILLRYLRKRNPEE